MSTPSTSQSSGEEFNATIKFPAGNFAFKANKISIERRLDQSNNNCWVLKAFHDGLNDSTNKFGLARIKEVFAIHLCIGDELSKTNDELVHACAPPNVFKNSGSLFKIVDKIPDEDNLIDTTDNYLGIQGEISYAWDEKRTRVQGTFRLLVGDSVDPRPHKDILLHGNFNLLNSGPHSI